MDYQALYRKYRPQRFDELIGQSHVTGTLTREVIEGKIAHAYLFAGPRGTGKTTSARLLAKALNCVAPEPGGEPDNVCNSCVEISEGRSLDVIELDAASHNKVEDIREIRMNVGTVAAVGGARRVYILDEAHMLSRAAGNALLKTLEEPPEHVVFVLATTEPYKMLDTIRSRAQRFDFHPVPVEILIDHLAGIAEKEGFEASAEALAMVASHASGSVRDSLSLLEQVASLGGGKVEARSVARALGLADRDAFGALVGAIADQNAPAALTLVATLASQGADLRRFVSEALSFFRGLFLAQYAPNLEEVVDEPLETIEEWRRHASTLGAGDVLRTIDQLAAALTELREGREERLVVELALLRLTRPETVADPAALDARLTRLEAQVRLLAAAQPVRPAPAAPPRMDEPRHETGTARAFDDPAADRSAPFTEGAAGVVAADEVPGAAVAAAPGPVLDTLDLSEFEAIWPALVARIRDDAGPRRHAWLKESSPVSVRDGTVTLEVPARLPFHFEQLKADDELTALVGAVAASLLGGGIAIEYELGSDELEAHADPERVPDKDELFDGSDGEGGDDPAALVVEALGGEIVSD